MSWKNKYLSLTVDQKDRGVIYSSALIVKNRPDIKVVTHEVYGEDENAQQKIRNLKDTSFFKNMAYDMGWDVVNEIRR